MRDLIRARFQVGATTPGPATAQDVFAAAEPALRRWQLQLVARVHLRYLAKLKMPFPVQQIVFQEMLDVISEATARLERYDREIGTCAVPGWRWERAVRALMSLRGMALLHAATLVAESWATSTALSIPAS